MAKVKLEFETDLLPLANALQDGEQLISKTRGAVVSLGKDSKTAFAAANTEASKFAAEVKHGAGEVAVLDKTVKAAQDVFAAKQDAGVKTFEEQQSAISAVKQKLAELLEFERKLIEEQSKVGPVNIKEQFTPQIEEAKKQVEGLTAQLRELQNLNITPTITPQFGPQTASGVKPSAPSPGTTPPPVAAGVAPELPKVPADYVNRVRAIKKEIMELTSAAIDAGHGTKEFEENLKKAGALKNELHSLTESIAAVTGNKTQNIGKGFREATELGIKGFEGLIAVESLAGVETENVERQILKLQAVASLSRVVAEFGGLKDKLHDIKLAFAPLGNLYARGNDALKSFGKQGKESTDGVAKSSKNLFSTFGNGIKGLVTSGINGFKALWATVAANPLGVVLVVIGGVIAAMVALKDKVKPIAALFEFLGKTVDALLFPFKALGQAFGILASQHEVATKKMIENTKKQEESVASFFDSEIKLAEASGKRTADLEQRKVRELQETVKARLVALQWLHKENGKLTEEELKEYEESQKTLLDLTRESAVLIAKEQTDKKEFVKQQLSAIEDLRIAAIKDDETREKEQLAKKFLNEVNAAEDRIKAVTGVVSQQERALVPELVALEKAYNKELADIRAKYAAKRLEKIKQDNDKLLALQKEFTDAFAAIQQKVEQGQLAELNGEARIQKEREIAIREIDLLRENLIKKGQLEEDFEAQLQKRKPQVFKLNNEQEQAFQELRRQTFKKETDDLVKLQVDRENKIANAKTQNAQTQEATLSTQEATQIAAVDLTPPPKIDENAFQADKVAQAAEFEKSKQQAVLNIQRDFAQKKLDLQKQTREAERAEQLKGYDGELALLGDRNDAEAQMRRDQIIEAVQLLEQKFAAEGDKADTEFAKIINDLQDKQDELNKKPPFDLMTFLGLTPEMLQGLQMAVQQVQQTLDQVNQQQLDRVDKEIEESNRRKADAENQVRTLEGQLNAESDLAERGKANNAGRIQAEIDMQKQAAAREAEIQKKALEEKKRIQKEKLLLDSIIQGSNLVTASTNILATTAKDPVSLAIALGTVATMITAFIALKAQALKAINAEGAGAAGAPRGFAKGVIDLQGPGTETSDSIKGYNLSRGESVMTAKETREYKKLLLGLRSGDRSLIKEGVEHVVYKHNIDKGDRVRTNDHRLVRESVFNLITKESQHTVQRAMQAARPLITESVRVLTAGAVTLPSDLPAQITRARDTLSKNEFSAFLSNDFTPLQREQQKTNQRLDEIIAGQKNAIYKDSAGNVVYKNATHTITKKKL